MTTDGTATSRTTNRQNQVTGVGTATLTYDANGNLTTDETDRALKYDAWNRLVEVKDASGSVLAAYRHDALGRRITEASGGTTRELYYSSAWQVLEERVGGLAQVQYVWSPVYVDALVLRDRDTTGSGTRDERLWVLQDASYNVTALVNASGQVVERYAYTPYGEVSVLAPDWTAGSAYGWRYLHQGGRYDAAAGLYSFRHRDYSPTLARWVSQDPLGFGGGDTNLYRDVGNSPVSYADPSGEIAHVVGGAVLGAVINTVVYGATALATGQFSWGGFWGAAAQGAVIGGTVAATGGISVAGWAGAGAAAGVIGSGVQQQVDRGRINLADQGNRI